MIIITPEAVRELQELASKGVPSVLRFDADPDGDGGYECSVGLVDAAPTEAKIDEVEGVTVAFCGMAESIFAGSIVGLDADGELTLEMAEGDCECGAHGHEEGGCGCGHNHGHGHEESGCGCGHSHGHGHGHGGGCGCGG